MCKVHSGCKRVGVRYYRYMAVMRFACALRYEIDMEFISELW